MNGEAVREYVDRSKSIIEASPQMDEENTRAKLVQPFIELLGWDIYSTAVELEYSIQMGTGTKKVDYALLVDGAPKLLVEAKGLDVGLDTKAKDQLKSYLRQELAAEWGIITDGETFEILQKSDRNDGGELSIGTFTLDDIAESPDILDIVTRESIASGKANEKIERLREARLARSRLEENKDELSEAISTAIVDTIGDIQTLSLESEAKVFVDDLVQSVERKEREITKQQSSTGTSSPGRDTPTPVSPTGDGEGAVVGTIRRSEIQGPDDALVAVFPTRKSGLQFLKDNNAWGFVRVGRRPDFVAMYVTEGESEIRYVAEVEAIVKPTEADLVKPAEEYTDQAEFGEDKRVVVFKDNSLYRLEDPIPYESRYPQGLRYSTVEKLRTAKTTDDVI